MADCCLPVALMFRLMQKIIFGYVGKTLINGKEVRFLVPTTFMNLAEKAVALANGRIKPEEI